MYKTGRQLHPAKLCFMKQRKHNHIRNYRQLSYTCVCTYPYCHFSSRAALSDILQYREGVQERSTQGGSSGGGPLTIRQYRHRALLRTTTEQRSDRNEDSQ